MEAEPAYESRRVSMYDRDPQHLPDFEDVMLRHELNLQNTTRGCMKRKGYRLTRASKLSSEVHRKTTCISGECFPVAGK